jgi:hypothetical protein
VTPYGVVVGVTVSELPDVCISHLHFRYPVDGGSYSSETWLPMCKVARFYVRQGISFHSHRCEDLHLIKHDYYCYYYYYYYYYYCATSDCVV